MTIWKKAVSAATSAALLASLLATAVAPAAFGAVTVTSAGNVPQGGSSVGTATFKIEEQAINSLATNGPGTIDIVITDSAGLVTLGFSGTPVVSAPGSLGATAAVQIVGGNTLRFSWTNTDVGNIESIQASGLTIDDVSATGATLGAIKATLVNPTGNASVAAFQAGGTASGTISAGIGIAATSVIVNVTTPGCLFVATGVDIDPGVPVVTSGKYDFVTNPESVTGTAAAGPGVGQQTLTISATASGHLASEVINQTTACLPNGVLASPGAVVATLVFSNPTPKLTVFPGENNSKAQDLVLTEPSAGFLAKDSTITYKIATAGVVFSTAPKSNVSTLGIGLSAPVLSVDRLSATVTVTTASTAAGASIHLTSILYDVAATVPAGTFISVGVTTSGAKSVSPTSRTNAVVFRGIVASATTPTVYIGENGQAAGIVSFTEAAPAFFTDGTGSNNTFMICPSGVGYVFTLAPYAKVTGGVAAGNLILRDGAGASTTNLVKGTQSSLEGKTNCYFWTVWTKSTTASTIQIGNVDLTSGPIINVNVNQAPGGVNVALDIGTNKLDGLVPAAVVQFATAVYRNQVAVTALSQPLIAPGATNAPAGNLQIAETSLGQLKLNEEICFEILWRSGELQDQFLNSLNTADLPVATASGTGLVVSPVKFSSLTCGNTTATVPTGYAQSFHFNILQQSTKGDGKIVISGIRYTALTDTADGPVQLSVWGKGKTPTEVIFHSTVSNATIGVAAPLPTLKINATSALGNNPTSGYTTKTPKVQVVGKYITWKFTGGTALAGQRVNVLVAQRINGAWGGPKYFVSRTADANGIVTFIWKSNSALVVNARVQWPGSASFAVSTSPALGAHWQ